MFIQSLYFCSLCIIYSLQLLCFVIIYYLVNVPITILQSNICFLDENGEEPPTSNDKAEDVKISKDSNSDLPSGENKEMNTEQEVILTKQLSEEENVINTAVED